MFYFLFLKEIDTIGHGLYSYIMCVTTIHIILSVLPSNVTKLQLNIIISIIKKTDVKLGLCINTSPKPKNNCGIDNLKQSQRLI